MPKRIGIVVDGQGDFAAITRRLGTTCRVLKSDGPRGHTVSPFNLVTGSRKQLQMLQSFGCRRAILMTDLEQRRESYDQFFRQLEKELRRLPFNLDMQPAVPNMMIENWYLADVEQLSRRRSYIRDKLKQRNYEGKNGKKELKRLFVKGSYYEEVRHGADLFSIIRFPTASKNSKSFEHFARCLAIADSRSEFRC
jgi:hypothetical protein